MESPKGETKVGTDPFADIAAKVRVENPPNEKIKEEQQFEQDVKAAERIVEGEQFKKSLEDYKDSAREGYAGPQIIRVDIPVGTSVPGCEETDECYDPSHVSINQDDVILWANKDTAANTVTSGSPSEGLDGSWQGRGNFPESADKYALSAEQYSEAAAYYLRLNDYWNAAEYNGRASLAHEESAIIHSGLHDFSNSLLHYLLSDKFNAHSLQNKGTVLFGDAYLLPPRFQVHLVDDPNEIVCKEGLELIFKMMILLHVSHLQAK